MGHEGQVDVVQAAEADQFGLAAEELDLAGGAQAHAVLDFDVFLGRHRHERHVPVEVGHHPAFHQPAGQRHEVGDLGVVPAGVRGARHRVSIGMRAHHDGVHLTHVGDRRQRPGAVQGAAHARHGQPRRRIQPEGAEAVRHEGGGAELFEAEFGVQADVLAEGDDLLAVGVDARPHSFLQRLCIDHDPCSFRQ